MVYDYSNRETFDYLSQIISQLNSYSEQNFQIMIIGVKLADESERAVTFEEAKDFGKRNGITRVYEASPRNCQECQKAFDEFIADVSAL